MSSDESATNTSEFEELERLLLSSLDEDYSEAERERLNAILRESPEARAFASGVMFDDALLTDSLSTEAAEVAFKDQAPTPTKKTGPAPRTTWLRIAALLALALLPLTWLTQQPDGPTDFGDPVARIQATNRGSGLEKGHTYFIDEQIDIEKGRVVLRFATGAKLSVEAPASLTLTGSNSADLERGRGTVRVPGEIKGFTITTPTEKVVDLGTACGVEVAEEGRTSVAVFEGEVELRGRPRPQRLIAGQSTETTEPSQPAKAIPHLIDAFLNTWETSFGVESTSGDLRVAKPGERLSPGNAIDPESLLLFPERESVVLPKGYALNSTRTGLHERPFGKRHDLLSEEHIVDSYLLQYHPGFDSSERTEVRIFEAELQFDRPVIGLILTASRLQGSDAELAMPGAQLENIERRGINFDDSLELSDDRRTLRIRLSITNSVDQIRVLVDANA